MQAIEGRWPGLLERMVTRRVPLARFGPTELEHPGDLKVVVDVAA